MADNWLADITLGFGANAAVVLLCWLRGAPSSTGLQLSSDTRRAVESRNGPSIYATFPGHFSSGLCGEDVQLAGGVVVTVAVMAAVAAEITATAASMSRTAMDTALKALATTAMESWGVELTLGFGMNMAVLTFCWISGWRPVDTSSSILWHDAHREDEETNDTDEYELSILWNGGTETTIGLVVAVAVMMAVAVEIASKTGSAGTARC